MAPDTSLISLGDLTKPATVLIEKIADAVGAAFAPYQIVRIAKAEIEVERIRSEARSDLETRALGRLLKEEARRQQNIEEITRLAIPQLQESANPTAVENDWLVNFFDKCRLTSDEELQSLWSRILSGEANTPGRFGKRTVNLVATLTKLEAEQFTALCSFCWMMGEDVDDQIPVVFDEVDPVYRMQGVTFESIAHLESIGLVRYESTGFRQFETERQPTYTYFGRKIKLTLPFPRNINDYEIPVGRVMLTRMGVELSLIAGAEPSERFFDYVVRKWRALKYHPIVVNPSPTAG